MDKLLDIRGEVIPSGTHPSLPNQQVPLWEDSDNVVYEELAVKPGAGQGTLFAKLSSQAGLGVLETRINDVRNLFWATRTKLYRGIEGTVDPTDVTRLAGGDYTGDDSDLWSIQEFGNQVVATQGVDQPQIFLVAASEFDDFSDQTDLPNTFRASIFKKLKAHILAFNTDNESREMRWCDEDDVLTWIPTASNSARDIVIRGLETEVRCVQPIGEGLGVYGANQLFYVTWEGPPFFFGAEHILTGIGAVGKHSVISIGRRHFGLGPDGVFVTDGATLEYIDPPSIHKYIYVDNVDKALLERTVAWHDREESMIYFSVPTGDGAGLTVGFNYRIGAWSLHSFYRTAATSGSIWDDPIVIDAAGTVLQQGIQGIPVQGEPQPVTTLHRATFQSGFGELGFGEGGFGGLWYEPGPLSTDEE